MADFHRDCCRKVTNPEIELTDQSAGGPYYSRDGGVGIIYIDSSVKDHRWGFLALDHEFMHHILTEFVSEEASSKYDGKIACLLESHLSPDLLAKLRYREADCDG